MKDLPDILEKHRSQLADQHPWIWLYEFCVPTEPSSRYFLTNSTESVTFGTDPDGAGITYSPFPISHGGIRDQGDGDLPTIEVTVGNVSREIMASLEAYDGLIGQHVNIRLVNADALGRSTNQISESAQVHGVRAGTTWAVFTLGAHNLYQAAFPRNRFIRHRCGLIYGGDRCGYSIPSFADNTVGGGFDFCPKTLTACEERGDDEVARGLARLHPLRHGAFRGIPRLISRVGL